MRFVTSNPNKLRELRIHIPDIEPLELDLPEIQSLDPHTIIRAKLESARSYTDEDLIVEDTSLMMDCLGRLPGPLIKHFLEELGVEGIAHLITRYSEDTHATARTIIGYASGEKMEFFEGTVRGKIVEPRGEGFGWDPIFEPEGYDQTYAELGEEKHTMSPRTKAVEKLVSFLRNG
ncbi:MAG: non-canonical purine NTP pyrophosphatase [Candidatus Woesearchaeota archaeon]